MGKPGPKPHSADVIELRGNRAKMSKAELEERRASEVKPRPMAPSPPADLHPYAKEAWEGHAKELQALGLLTVLDGASFALLCEWYAIAREALEALHSRTKAGAKTKRKRYDVVLEDQAHGGRLHRHPALLVLKQASEAYVGLCKEFGLTPSSRVGLRPAAPPPGSSSEGDDGDAADGFDF